ncbi:MAG: hypothetical protein IJ105_01080 [Bacilli bacterium]|nr:hypothetical protein [Bacilli bacterium]
MNISSLSIQSKRRLSELLEDLTDILNRKDSLIENASKEINRMNTIIDMQNKLDAKGSELTNIATPIDAKELQELVEKSDKLSIEKEEINAKSRQLNNDLEELSNIENSLMEEINQLLLSNNIQEDNNQSIYVESLDSHVYIVDAQIPENKDVISQEHCEIINCNINLIAEISKLYNSNINKIVIDNEENDFDELKEKVEKYNNDKNNSYDKQLELLKKSFEKEDEKPIIEEQQEQVIELPKEEIPEETLNNQKIELDTQENESIVPLSTILPETKEVKTDIPSNNEPNNIIYIDSSDKVVPNQIARATKEKLNNKIIQIFSGSYPETQIKVISPLTQNEENPFNLENFVTNKTA